MSDRANFHIVAEAQNFESCILSLHETQQVKLLSKLEVTSVHQEVLLYRLFDAEDTDQEYYAFVLARKNPKAFHYGEIYYGKYDVSIQQVKRGVSMH